MFVYLYQKITAVAVLIFGLIVPAYCETPVCFPSSDPNYMISLNLCRCIVLMLVHFLTVLFTVFVGSLQYFLQSQQTVWKYSISICAQWRKNWGLILNTVARCSTCGQQLFKNATFTDVFHHWEDGLYMTLSLKLVLDRKQKKKCGIQLCRKVRKPTTTRKHSTTGHQKVQEPWGKLKQVNSPLYFWSVRLQPPASGWSAEWGTSGSPAAAAVQHHWEGNT